MSLYDDHCRESFDRAQRAYDMQSDDRFFDDIDEGLEENPSEVIDEEESYKIMEYLEKLKRC